ncbi:hypothetical protein QL285_040723 [Trifolium repens]|nr:hypothetical protein QL285_040723 [Trifolium repens]
MAHETTQETIRVLGIKKRTEEEQSPFSFLSVAASPFSFSLTLTLLLTLSAFTISSFTTATTTGTTKTAIFFFSVDLLLLLLCLVAESPTSVRKEPPVMLLFSNNPTLSFGSMGENPDACTMDNAKCEVESFESMGENPDACTMDNAKCEVERETIELLQLQKLLLDSKSKSLEILVPNKRRNN